MLKRKIETSLIKWKKEDGKKCLMIRGARQVGKTFIVERFGETYPSFVEVNFLKNPAYRLIFSGDLDIDTLLLNFSVYMPAAQFIPGKTLLFLDEIQECPEAVTSLKFWAQDGRFDVVVSGSMLGIDYLRPQSYPVGSVTYLDMRSLDFEEFLYASGMQENAVDLLRKCFADKTAVPYAIHDRIMKKLREYLVVGGMPEVVQLYFQENSLSKADQKQRDILTDYRYDIAHYAPPDIKLKAEKCYFSLPDQLSKENHKFQYTVVEKGSNARKYGTSLEWLEAADIVIRCCNVSKPAFPLKNFREDTNYRIYPSDIGLLTGMFPYEMKMRLLENERIGSAKGGLYEALIADMVMKSGHAELYFRKNKQSTFEIEFLLENEDGVIPVEVKAGNSRSRSLDTMLEREEIPYGYKLISGNMGVSGKKITAPLYMAMFL